jgi:hypothetical protein
MSDPALGRSVDGLSVVVASFRSVDLVDACVEALDRAVAEISPRPARVFLARRGDADDVRHLERGRSWLTVVACPGATTIPELRGAGMGAAGGGWIAVTEDHCLVEPDWLSVLEGRTGEDVDVVGGGVGNARAGLVNWGAYFSEYGFFSSFRPEQPGPLLVTGANVLYAPEVSATVGEWAREGLWEDVIHGRLHSSGAHLSFEPAARVRQNARYSFVAFCGDRFEHGRDYARVRLREQEVGRLSRALTTPLLPVVLLARVRRSARGESPTMFRASTPFIFAFLAAWAAGEAAGYLLGPEKESRDR